MKTYFKTLNSKKVVSLIIFCFIIGSTVSQGIEPVKGYYRENFVFSSGYWVYQDTINDDIDSITLLNCIHGYVSPTPIIPDYWEYFTMNYHSSTYDISYNDYIITYYWKRNGGGQYGELGQPIMIIGQYVQWPIVGTGFNGFEIINILDSIEVNGNTFYDVVVSRVYEDQQYQYEFEYTTDLYFAPQVGIIRKAYSDSLNLNHSWDLVNWQTDIYTGIDDNFTVNDPILIYPNPAHGAFVVKSVDLKNVELIDIQGRSIINFECNSDEFTVTIKPFQLGLYFVKVITGTNVLYKTIIIE